MTTSRLSRSTDRQPRPVGARPWRMGVWMTAALLAACASQLPPLIWLRLPAEAPAQALGPQGATAVVPNPSTGANAHTWQLMSPVSLPGHLDHDALLVPQGSAGLQPLAGARWAEPLRDAVPRLLRQDVARRLAQPLWTAPLPPGVRPDRQLRLDIDTLDVAPDGRSVHLRAHWSLADVNGRSPPQLHEAAFVVPGTGADADALVLAHRQALWLLAGRIAATL